ncbi:hypothetical protein CC80DRAFT_520260 [Byssothecium circinans]|uniref:P-loop containing nucleoside triphosphate hydrolase protein n=1 Tax=Byssothecium circinans TaxID=147558 RepID=A0A6A5TCC1_9PLEO|nr:hypothetical protein CC80DRAFT_520260 [Byssothecium circinans]
MTNGTVSPLAQSMGHIILLNGFPGVGKHAIARAMQDSLPKSTTRLIDNHILIDPAEAIRPGRGPSHKALRKAICSVAFSAIKEDLNANPDLVFIMSACVGNNSDDIAVLHEYLDITRGTSVSFHMLNLRCGVEEHRKRFEGVERYQAGKKKLGDGKVLDALVRENELVDLGEVNVGEGILFQGKEFDTTDLPIEKSAAEILGMVGWKG